MKKKNKTKTPKLMAKKVTSKTTPNDQKEEDEKILRVASIALVNAMLFQEILAQRTKVKSLNATLQESDIVSEFAKQWKNIEDNIDFVSIFNIARRSILTIPANPNAIAGLRKLADTAIKISKNRTALRHDLMGRIFHRLLKDAKYLGAYYTKIPSASLLLKLTTDGNEWDVDWADAKSISKLKIADLASGTGTLLKSALSSIVNKHNVESAAGGNLPNPSDVHKQLVENSLYGFDVLTSAVHIAAAAISMHDPNVSVDKINIQALPLGGPKDKLGSLEFAAGMTISDIYAQTTLSGGIIGPSNVITSTKGNIKIPKLNLCTMNPPFTRSAFNNLLFGGIPAADRKKLQTKLKKILQDKKLDANLAAGLGPAFIAIADKLLIKNGVLALVLPKAVLNGDSWEPTRKIFSKYDLQYVISSHEPSNWNFSENTSLSEILLILKRGRTKNCFVVFVNLWKQPKNSIQAIAVADKIQKSNPADLTADSGTEEIIIANEKFGEIIKIPQDELHTIPWILPSNFAQTDLIRFCYHLDKNKIFIPTKGEVGSFKTKKLSSVVKLGPDFRIVTSTFAKSNSPTSYRELFGYEPSIMKTLELQPNFYLRTRTTPTKSKDQSITYKITNPNELWNEAGELMLPKKPRINTAILLAAKLTAKALSNVWWPSNWISTDKDESKKMERRLVLWFNSTFGLCTLLNHQVPTEGSFLAFPKGMYENLQVLDMTSLDKSQLKILDDLWDKISKSELKSLSEINNDKIRKEIDEAFCKIFGIESITEIHSLLSREPILSQKMIV